MEQITMVILGTYQYMRSEKSIVLRGLPTYAQMGHFSFVVTLDQLQVGDTRSQCGQRLSLPSGDKSDHHILYTPHGFPPDISYSSTLAISIKLQYYEKFDKSKETWPMDRR